MPEHDYTPEGYVKADGYGDETQGFRAYVKGNDVVVCGVPADTDDEESAHNCDQMGCGSMDHVLFRFQLPVAQPTSVELVADSLDTLAEDGIADSRSHVTVSVGYLRNLANALRPTGAPTTVYVVFSNIPGGPDEEAVFVEVETADGTGITLAKSADWHPHPVAPHLARLGPFYAHPEGT
jgi:hypothetical protein